MWEYGKWVEISAKFEAFKDVAGDWWEGCGRLGNTEKVVMGDIWKKYKEYREKRDGRTLREEWRL